MAEHVTLAHDNTKSASWESDSSYQADDRSLLLETLIDECSLAAELSQIGENQAALELLDKVHARLGVLNRDAAGKVDTRAPNHHTDAMNEITREEFNAKLETIEVKMDARVESMSSKIDVFLAAQAERDKRLDDSLANIRGDISRLGSLKLSIWGAMFTGLAITLTVIGLGLTAYQAGQADRHQVDQAPAITAPQQQSK